MKETPTQQVCRAPCVQQEGGSLTQNFSGQQVAAFRWLGAPGGDTS